MNPPRIGYTSRKQDNSYFLQWQRDYWFSITLAGGEPVRLYANAKHDYDAILDDLDGLMLTGGGDIDPQEYGQEIDGTARESIHPDRDKMELELTRAAVERRIPVLGVCRGIQVINVALGGTLTQHIDTHTGKTNSFDAPRPHEVNIRLQSLLDRTLACGSVVVANSYHHQAISSNDLAPALIASGIAADGIIEAVEHPVHPWFLGVQWHPERLYELGDEHLQLFTEFVAAAHAYQSQKIEGSIE